jgi:hypothetical protein
MTNWQFFLFKATSSGISINHFPAIRYISRIASAVQYFGMPLLSGLKEQLY